MATAFADKKPHAGSRWTLRSYSDQTAKALASELKIHPAVARVLAARGHDSSGCADFLDPRLRSLRDPFELRDMELAVERAVTALKKNEKIGVFGDYDVDGVCSTAIIVLTLRRLGVDPLVVIPHRVHDGYGMNSARVKELAKAGVTLLITVDTGITAIEEIEEAKAVGMDVIVTDHHLADGDQIPDAVAVVNPNRFDAEYSGARLCGAGVAFKFAHALLKGFDFDSEDARSFLKDLLDLVALGTVADVVPLTGENRVLAHYGLLNLARSKRPGIRALLAETKLTGKTLQPDHIGFVLAPRINAAGRTEDPRTALELLLTDCSERAGALARYLDMLNQRRRQQESSILDGCLEQALKQMDSGEDSLIVVAGEDYHLGVVGIVASRLVEHFHRPSIVLRLEPDLAKGSARSIPGFDIHEALGACEEHLIGFGGHAAAAGVQMAPSAIDTFRTTINEFAKGVFQERDMSPEIDVDADLEPLEITWSFYHDLQRLQPFGQDNPQPIFMLRNASNAYTPRIVGTNHLKLAIKCGDCSFSAIGFGLGHLMSYCSDSLPYDILFKPTENTFRGNRKLELELVDLRPAAE